jgi:hypothetical protein
MVLYFLVAAVLTTECVYELMRCHALFHSWAALRCALNSSAFNCCFFLCRNLSSSLILWICAFLSVAAAAGEVWGILIWLA